MKLSAILMSALMIGMAVPASADVLPVQSSTRTLLYSGDASDFQLARDRHRHRGHSHRGHGHRHHKSYRSHRGHSHYHHRHHHHRHYRPYYYSRPSYRSPYYYSPYRRSGFGLRLYF